MPRVVLPASLRVFPLTGCILLPGNWLPLHIFEPRYRAMVRDALATDRLIGMIQPRVPAADNVAPTGDPAEGPELHPVGCVGKIEHSLPEPDGRFHILLKGVSRFTIVEEMSEQAGYRWFHVNYEAFSGDFRESSCNLDSSR
ncbi:MAG: LON peptidase substrate-binding domain-containing protein, partial [Acidobacteria bacterium]|nr:LON peptidase substrate-binding domain-containing protein [Acidobacteriota bacterium]